MEVAQLQYGPEPVYFDPIPLGEAQAAGPVDAPPASLLKTPAVGVEDPVLKPPAPTDGPRWSADEIAELECRVDQGGSRAPVPQAKLIAAIRAGLDYLGPLAPVDQIHSLVQTDLDRSGETPTMKIGALNAVRAGVGDNAAAASALGRAFELSNAGGAAEELDSACLNPAASGGGSAFGAGPFANAFATINPIPVLASRLTATAEGS